MYIKLDSIPYQIHWLTYMNVCIHCLNQLYKRTLLVSRGVNAPLQS